MARHPYEQLDENAFWRSGVADLNPLAVRKVWKPKYVIGPGDAMVTAGSCFAQHIGRAMAARGFKWLDAEPGPSFLLPADRLRLNYGIFSFRTSNIYTTALLRQWMEWSIGGVPPPDEIWREGERYFDPFRPNIEPAGFESETELVRSRQTTLNAIIRAVKECSIFTFTLGLTEAWTNKQQGYVYAACPGTAHGIYDPQRHAFRNFRHSEILADLTAALDLARSVNPEMRILLTVSPVPLTATASGAHVLVATTYSKSTLRSVAGEYVSERAYADYFPSYELIATAPFRGVFYEPNLRSVAPQGVDFVMDTFFRCLENTFPSAQSDTDLPKPSAAPALTVAVEGDVFCEEELLEQFNEH